MIRYIPNQTFAAILDAVVFPQEKPSMVRSSEIIPGTDRTSLNPPASIIDTKDVDSMYHICMYIDV